MQLHQLGHRLQLSDKAPHVCAPEDILKCKPSVHNPSYVVDGEDQKNDVRNSNHPRLEVRPSPGRGLGLFALDRIDAFTEIVNDTALLSLALGEDAPQLWQKYVTLPEAHRKIFDELSFPDTYNEKERIMIPKLTERGYPEEETRKMARVSSIFLANAFKTSDDPKETSKTASTTAQTWAHSLFPTVARINHSCTPNSHSHYDKFAGARSVYALHDIEAGTELEISYFDFTMPAAARHTRSRDWGFCCACPACTPTSDLRKGGYEEHIAKIHQTMKVLNSPAKLRDVLDAEKDLNRSILAAQRDAYPWLVATLPILYQLSFQTVWMQVRSTGEVRQGGFEALEKAIEWQIKLTGRNSGPTRETRILLEQWKGVVGDLKGG